MAPTQISAKGEAFTISGESCPEQAYKDPGGVVTVGPGLTMLSEVFAEYWRKTRGHALRIGDVLPRTEALTVFRKVMNEEYVPPVLINIAPKEQHHLDAAADVSWNCGPASTKWKWAVALRDGLVTKAASLLRQTALTIGGKGPIRGLVNRRTRQARLLEFADYGKGSAGINDSGISTSPEAIKEYQGWLKKIGLYKGALDGKAGKGSLTEGAVMNFQRATPGLEVDGVVGPATRAALLRAVAALDQKNAKLGGPAAITGGGFTLTDFEWWQIALGAGAVLVVLVLAFWIWNNRGVILRQRTPA